MTQQGTAMNQSRIIEQLSKQQPQLTKHQIANSQNVQKAIKKYQNKISQLLKLVQRQKKHNDSLKNQLKTLNETLNHMIQKINLKQQKKQNPAKQEDTIKKNLQAQIKKNVLMKKQLDTLRAKVRIFQGQKLIDLQDQIRQKDKVIQDQNNTIKMYQKIQKQQMNIDIYKKYQQANQKINSLNGELIHLKKKLTESKKNQQQHQKNVKRHHQQLLNIQNKQKKSVSIVKKQEQKFQQTNNQINKLKQKIQTLQNAKKTNQKALRIEIQNLKLKNKVLEQQLQDLKNQLNRKDKQSNILISKMKSISRRSQPSLQPIDKLPVKIEQINPNTSDLFDHRKQFKGLMHIPGSSRRFDDTQLLPLQRSYKIKNLKFTWFEQHILSLTTTYQLPDSSIKQIQSFNLQHSYKNFKTGELNFNQFQYIKDIQIYCSKFIQFLRIKTSRDHILQVGNEKNHTKCKKFVFDIRTNQKPISIMGAIQVKKLGNQTSYEHLISIGLQIKKKDIFTKNKFQTTKKSQSMRKTGSKLAFHAQNDKNIILEQNQK